MRLWMVTALATLSLWPLGAPRAGAQTGAGSAAPRGAPLGRADLPVWNVGDEWKYRWQSQRGKGTFTSVVDREEVMDGVTNYVVVTGARETYWRKSDLGFHLTKLDGKLEEKATPPRRDYAWPLTVGKSWEHTYTRDRQVDRQTDELTTATVVEREEAVTVPAGIFQSFKIVHRNTRTGLVGGEWWYAPAVKSYVRQRFRQPGVGFWVERELVAFRLAGAVAAPATPRPPAATSPSAAAPGPPSAAPASPSPPTPPTAPAKAGAARAEFAHKVIYRVTGTAAEASITYRNARGGTQQTAGRIPWEVTFDARAGNLLYVSAQNQGASGSVSCDITVDGEVKTTASSTGAYVIAECAEANEP